ncbi:hypothetical protein EJ110_NYTH53056 [Nymphaea thermarum]|nr:hypothetical protein EJ110_NYTH53056 [Nymphaea thermarum]
MTVRMMNVVMLVWCLAAAAAAEGETAAVVTDGERAVVAECQREDVRPTQRQQPSNGVSREITGLVQQDIVDTISAERKTAECFKGKVKKKFKEPTVDTKTSDAYGAWKEKSLGMLASAKTVVKDVHYKLSCRTVDAELLIKMAAGQVVQESENLAERAKVVGKKVVDNTKTIGEMVMENTLTKAKKLKGSTGDAITYIMERTGPSLSEITQEMAHDLKEKAMNAYSHVERKLHQTKEKDWNAITKIVEKMDPNVLGIAQGMAHDVKEKAMNAYSYVESKVHQAKEKDWYAERAKVVGKKVVDNTKTIGEMVMENTLTKAKKLKGSTLDAITNIVERTGPSLSEITQEMALDLKEKAMNAYGHVERKLHQTKEKDWNAITKIVEKMDPSILGIAQGMPHDVKEKAMNAYSYVESKVHQAKEKDWYARSLAASRRIIDDTNMIGREVIGSALDKAKQVKASAFNDVAYWTKIIGSSVSKTAQGMAHDVQVKTRDAYSHVKEKVKEEPQQMKELTGASDNLAGQMVHEKKVHEATRHGKDAADDDGRGDLSKEITGTSDNLAAPMVHENKVHEATCHGKHAVDDNEKGDLSQIIRKGVGVMYDALAHAVTLEMLSFLMNVLHSFAFSVVSGTCFWVTFISSQVLSSTLSRQQFELVQSKIYPVYLRTMACGLAICLATHLAICRWVSASQAHKLGAYNLLASLVFVLTNVCLGPQTVKVMHNRLKLEKEEGRCHKPNVDQGEPTLSAGATNVTDAAAHNTSATKTAGNIPTTTTSVHTEQEVAKVRLVQMNRLLKNLNSCSSALNVMSLIGLIWHQVHLSKQVSC